MTLASCASPHTRDMKQQSKRWTLIYSLLKQNCEQVKHDTLRTNLVPDVWKQLGIYIHTRFVVLFRFQGMHEEFVVAVRVSWQCLHLDVLTKQSTFLFTCLFYQCTQWIVQCFDQHLYQTQLCTILIWAHWKEVFKNTLKSFQFILLQNLSIYLFRYKTENVTSSCSFTFCFLNLKRSFKRNWHQLIKFFC